MIDDIGNWLGARVGLTPLEFRTNGLTRNGSGTTEDTLNVGEASFIQFFAAGTIFKDVSFFSEIEFTTTGTAVAFGQVHMNFTNLWGSYANLQVGRVTPVEFTSFSDTKRSFKSSDILALRSSNNVGDNSSRVRGARPGISYYGYSGPVVWFAGIDNGADTTDTDTEKNYWVGARLDLPASMKTAFTGSSVSYHYYDGTDTSGTSTAQVQDDFVRHTVGLNIRHRSDSELQFVYQHGKDDNFTFAATPLEVNFDGYTIIGSHKRDNWYYVLQFDRVASQDRSALEVAKISPSVWYFLRDNFKTGIFSEFDVEKTTEQKHVVGWEIRTMF